MKNFVDFIVDAAKNSELGKEFAKHAEESDHSTMSKWFKEKGYDIDEERCKKIKDNKDDLKNANLGYGY